MKATVQQRQHAQHLAAQLGLDWQDVMPLVQAGVTDRAHLVDWTAADIRALRKVGEVRAARLVKAIRDAGVYLPDDGYPRDLPSPLRTH